jgi:alkanesulfonate monooxygenase SsuD/methylene tetrahydromethanopterin reductase-like flavin-dependent oxidoreductase (luciferase family)
MMEVVVRFADVWNCAGASTPQEAVEKSKMLDAACVQAGRDPASIRRSVQQSWDGRDRGQLLDVVGQYYERGFTEQVIYLPGPDQARVAEAAAEALPELRSALVH